MFLNFEADDMTVFVRRRLPRFNENCFEVRECDFVLKK